MSYASIFKAEPSESGTIEAITSQCESCRWKNEGTVTCLAFPKAIPLPILLGVYDHNAHYADNHADDNGLTYSPRTNPVQLTAPAHKREPYLTSAGNLLQSSQVKKANPFHDAAGRFTTKENAVWNKTGSAKGSNPGGVYEVGGVKHYVKFPRHKGQIYAEQAADQVYDLMGVRTMGHKAQKVNGKTASVSKWNEVEPLGFKGWQKLTDAQKQQAADAFVTSALVKNWDVVGLVYDNMGKTKDGNLAILDTGGSFKYRAMGEPKHYGPDPRPEIETMLDPERKSGAVFGPLMKDHRDLFVKAAQKLASIPDDKLSAIANTMRDPQLGKDIVARKRMILTYFGQSIA